MKADTLNGLDAVLPSLVWLPRTPRVRASRAASELITLPLLLRSVVAVPALSKNGAAALASSRRNMIPERGSPFPDYRVLRFL